MYKILLISKDVALDGRKLSSFCFNLACVFVNKMNPIILLSIVCTWYLNTL